MTVPGIVESELGDEDAPARVPLGGDDELFVTPTRTLVYRSEGLLSDESVDEYPHDADRLSVSEGRRKSKVKLEYAVNGKRAFAVPSGRLDDALEPVLAGLLNARAVTDPDERIEQVYRFSELTLVITGERLLKHIGSTVWDDEHESYHFEDVTDLTYEEGSVATGIVLTVDGRRQRIKTPNERVAEVRKHLESALFSYRNVSSAEELAVDDEEDEPAGPDASAEGEEVTSFDTGVDPLETGEIEGDKGAATDDPDREHPGAGAAGKQGAASHGADPARTPPDVGGDGPSTPDETAADPAGTDETTADTATVGDPTTTGEPTTDDAGAEGNDGGDEFSWGVEAAGLPPEVAEHLVEIREAIEHQNELLAEQQQTIQRLAEQADER